MRVAVIGGGITGLAAAHELVRQGRAEGPAASVELFEASGRLGGKVRTVPLDEAGPAFEGAMVEAGPDSLYTFKPWALELARMLGLGDQVVTPDPARRRTLVVRGGRLVELPDGLFALMPTRVGPFLRSPIVSWAGKVRMGLDVVIPPRPGDSDESLGAFVRRRLGAEAVRYLAEPLLAGIHAGDPWELSLLATYPSLRQDELRYGGLVRAMLARRHGRHPARGRPAAAGYGTSPNGAGFSSPFATFRGGLSQLVQALEAYLRPRVLLHTGAAVTGLEPPGSEGGWRVLLAGGRASGPFDAVVVTVPPPAAARLVRTWDPGMAAGLEQFVFASTAVAALVYRPGAVGEGSPVRRTSGMLVPSVEARRMGLHLTACTWASSKWPHTSPRGLVVIRCFVGRHGDDAALELPDERLLEALQEDLARIAGIEQPPLWRQLFRWPQAMPQYRVGHLGLVEQVQRQVSRWPGLFVTGAAWRGMGISDCVRQGREAAQRCLAWASQAVRKGA
ncbi:MAG: protoporphyrinogen oxidase [Limnochordaceae bacterium]|nr:protoporphyrinogen oxidase [Limnochordaceae bacterium]